MAEDVDAVMQTIPPEWRTRWCEAEWCACMGCVQVGNRLVMTNLKVTQVDPEHIDESSVSADIYRKFKHNQRRMVGMDGASVLSQEKAPVCGCEFDPDPDSDDENTPETAWHYKRVCGHCYGIWWGLHCRHDGYQNPCPHCGIRPSNPHLPVVPEISQEKTRELHAR